MHDDAYGWAVTYPQWRLSTTSQSMSNQPTNPLHIDNLSKLSDFLGMLPFQVQVNSGFRTSAVNSAVGGSATSQHMNGLGADIKPLVPGANNKDLATYFWHYRDKIPELDQVIWYTGTSHTHIGICPKGGTGCRSGAVPGQGRHEFMVKDGGSYRGWSPSSADLASPGARILIAMGPPRDWKKIGLITTGVVAGVVVLGAAAVWWFSRE